MLLLLLTVTLLLLGLTVLLFASPVDEEGLDSHGAMNVLLARLLFGCVSVEEDSFKESGEDFLVESALGMLFVLVFV